MKFNENLQKLRKEKGLSQEALAEQLDVTRQSVSKWESGASYPEMDKLIALCQLFECDLDSLVNGTTTKKKEEEAKEFTGKELWKKFDIFMKKIVFFFENMTGKDFIKFLFEILILLAFLLLFRLPFALLEGVVEQFLKSYGDFYRIIDLVCFFVDLIYLIFAVLLFVYALKVKYFDKIEEKKIQEEIINNFKEKPQLSKNSTSEAVQIEKIYIQKTGKSLSDVLSSLALWFLKFWVFLFLIGFVIGLFILLVLFAISLSLVLEGLPTLGIVFALFGGILFLLCIILPGIRFLFNQKNHIKPLLWTAFSSIVFFVLGATIFSFNLMHITYYDELSPQIEKRSFSREIPMQSHINTCYLPNHHVSYQVNEDLKDKVQIKIDTAFQQCELRQDENGHLFIDFTGNQGLSFQEIFKIIKKDLKEGKLYNYDFDGFFEITIESSNENLNQIQSNRYHCYS